MHKCMRTYACAYVCVCVCVCTVNTYMCMRAYMCVYMHACITFDDPPTSIEVGLAGFGPPILKSFLRLCKHKSRDIGGALCHSE